MARKATSAASKPTASAAAPRSRVVSTTSFRRGKDGRVFRMDLKTKPVGKIITAKVDGRVKNIAITR